MPSSRESFNTTKVKLLLHFYAVPNTTLLFYLYFFRLKTFPNNSGTQV